MMIFRKLLLFFTLLSGITKAYPYSDTSISRDIFFRGTEYTKIFTVQSGTPWLDPNLTDKGWVIYYGVRYDYVLLQFDIEDDQLVSRDISGVFRIQLVKQKISEFGLDNRVFIRDPVQDIFYERVYRGNYDVLIRWQKVLIRRGVEDGVYKIYKEFFISTGETHSKVQTSKDLFAFFGQHSKEMKEYFREQNLSFKKDPERALLTLVKYAEINGWHGR